MKKVVVLFALIITVAGGLALWLTSGGELLEPREIAMIGGLVLVILFAAFLGFRRIISLRRSQPPEDEMSKRILKRAAASSYYLSLYTWLALMFFSDTTEMELSSFIGMGIMIMAIEFALAWVYHNYFAKING